MSPLNRLPRAVGVVAVAALFVAGCGSSSSSASHSTDAPTAAPTTLIGAPATSAPMGSSPTSSGSSAAPTIKIHDYNFGLPITVTAGAKVTVQNTDSETHSVSSDDGSFTAGNVVPGRTITFTAPSKPGRYRFHCNFHASMHGSLTVTAP